MILPNGVTGFYNSEAIKPPKVEGKQFKQLCFDIVSRNGGKVIDFNTPQYPANFYYAQVEILGNRFYILLNEHYPYLAFASAVEFGNIKFIDNPVLYEQFSPFFRVIGTVELNVPFNQNLVKKTELNSAELEQLAYWKPETVGQIIFNYWD
ncbi:hypothetical protein [Metabacillus litoralis]|jgi:hypothetical protein|uniref:hypothetical protein n=1 Tax=Metabacillus litoralis TaxID=152268 RepID=UPI00203A98BA|nr:hypothetical protein [Metabacillus litoralis]MCM3654797.1 hypothetical protein [Metabacillus litoralis]